MCFPASQMFDSPGIPINHWLNNNCRELKGITIAPLKKSQTAREIINRLDGVRRGRWINQDARTIPFPNIVRTIRISTTMSKMVFSGLMKTSTRLTTLSVLFMNERSSRKLSISNVYIFFNLSSIWSWPEELKLITIVIIINWNFVINGLLEQA